MPSHSLSASLSPQQLSSLSSASSQGFLSSSAVFALGVVSALDSVSASAACVLDKASVRDFDSGFCVCVIFPGYRALCAPHVQSYGGHGLWRGEMGGFECAGWRGRPCGRWKGEECEDQVSILTVLIEERMASCKMPFGMQIDS